MLECQKDFAALGKAWGFDSDELRAHIFEHGTLQNADVPDVVKEIFRSARDITPEWHVRMQAAFQAHITSSISKTVNLSHDANREAVRGAYILAHQCHCKGVTVYRDGCRENQPMVVGTSNRAKGILVTPDAEQFRTPVDVPKFMHAVRMRHNSVWGNLHMSISLELTSDGRYREREVFFNLGRSGDGVHPMTEAYGRLISMILRLDGGLPIVIDQLRSQVLASHHNNGSGKATSPPHELALGLMEYYKQTSSFRDSDGFLTQIPSLHPGAEHMPVERSGGNGQNNSERSQEFIRRMAVSTATVGMYRVPCPMPGCAGELIYTEGCQKCLTCGEGSCL
jgi:ribonucleoside-diphosphate reductase alpha chain